MRVQLPEVSIVMAVRDTPEYALRESLDSIFLQEFRNFELICVDDGSLNEPTRRTLSIYEKQDNRMRVIWLKKSVGAGAAKNVGLREVKGKYIISLDSDDYFPPTYIKELYERIVKDGADVCVTGFSVFNEDGEKKEITSVHKLDRDYSSYLEKGDFLIEGTLSACNKMVLADYIKSENIGFITTETDDDVLYGALVLLCTNNISIINDADGFLYRFNTTYQLSSHMNPLDLLTGIINVENELLKRDKYSTSAEKMLSTYLIHTGLMEMDFCKCLEYNRNFYKKTSTYLKGKNMNVLVGQTRLYGNNWITLAFDSKWFEQIGQYETQLENNREKVVGLLNNTSGKLIVWGMGKRGKAFESFAKKNAIEIYAVCDQSNSKCGELDDYNNIILNTNEVLRLDDVIIIATNNQISYDIKERYGIDSVSIETYCGI